jgi:putative DNA primase/helicase
MPERIGDEGIYHRINELKRGNIQFTDATNAARLAKEQGDSIRYNSEWKKWIVWNGRYWQTDESDALIHDKGLGVVRNIYDDVLKTSDYRERLDIEKYAMMCESVRRREAFVKAAQWNPDLNIKSDALDPDPWLLNVGNGTINVLTGEFGEHRRGEMITKIANVEFDPDHAYGKFMEVF